MSLYLDYNASAPIDERVLNVMVDTYKSGFGNADSRTHEFGDNARKKVEDARESVASLFGVKKDEVFFTSGATESNNIAIQGLREYGLKNNKLHIITTSIEHKAVLESAKHLGESGFEIEYINPGRNGRIDADEIISKVRDDTLLVSVMHVNNETGVIQPVEVIGEYLSTRGVLFHIDATQSSGKLVQEIQNLKYDMMSCSAHKMHGPQGVGVLILKKKKYKLPPVKPIMYGGNQERGIRPGTLPTALIVGFGEACRIANEEYEINDAKCREIKDIVLQLLEESGVEYVINGDQDNCISSTLNVSFIGVSSEALMLASKSYCGISNGSACTSSSYQPSFVLTAMGLDESITKSAVRISWGPETDANEFKNSILQLIENAKSLT